MLASERAVDGVAQTFDRLIGRIQTDSRAKRYREQLLARLKLHFRKGLPYLIDNPSRIFSCGPTENQAEFLAKGLDGLPEPPVAVKSLLKCITHTVQKSERDAQISTDSGIMRLSNDASKGCRENAISGPWLRAAAIRLTIAKWSNFRALSRQFLFLRTREKRCRIGPPVLIQQVGEQDFPLAAAQAIRISRRHRHKRRKRSQP